MLKILIVDDKNHARAQVAHSLRKLGCEAYEITWVETVAQLRTVNQQFYDLAFIDFFLSKDSRYGTEVLNKISARTVIGFSSHKNASVAIKEEADRMGFGETGAIQKIKETIGNAELEFFLRARLGDQDGP